MNGFPNGVTVGTNDHGAANRTVIGELSLLNDVEVPSIEVLRPRSDGLVLDSVDFLSVDSVIGLGYRGLSGEGGREYWSTEDAVVVAAENSRRTAGDGGQEERAQRR